MLFQKTLRTRVPRRVGFECKLSVADTSHSMLAPGTSGLGDLLA